MGRVGVYVYATAFTGLQAVGAVAAAGSVDTDLPRSARGAAITAMGRVAPRVYT